MRGKRRDDLSVFSVADEDACWFSSAKPSNCLGKKEEKGEAWTVTQHSEERQVTTKCSKKPVSPFPSEMEVGTTTFSGKRPDGRSPPGPERAYSVLKHHLEIRTPNGNLGGKEAGISCSWWWQENDIPATQEPFLALSSFQDCLL